MNQHFITRALPIVNYSAEASGEFATVWISDNIEQVTGFPAGEFLKDSGFWAGRLHPDDRERVFHEFERLHEVGMVSVEYRWQVADGTYHWLLDRAVLNPTANRHPKEILGLWLDVTDITERKPGPLKAAREELERRVVERTADLIEAKERLQLLSRRLMEAQEMERRALARDLHDEIGQALTALRLNLQEVRDFSKGESVGQQVDDSLEILNEVLQRVRGWALDLRPSLLDELGLVPALRWYVAKQAERAGWDLSFRADGITMRPPADVEIACFRIAQEALTNVARHAQANKVGVLLEIVAHELTLIIRDDGNGFEPAYVRSAARVGASVGLSGMEERVRLVDGRLVIHSAPAMGTEIRATFPIAPTRSE